MYSKEIKLAEKLIRKNQPRDGILLLVKTLVKYNGNDVRQTKEYQTAGQLLAFVFSVKNYRAIIYEYTKEVSQTGAIYLINIAVEFGQLKGAIAALEELYSLKDMEMETLNYYLDILDSFMDRDKALGVAHEYLKIHHQLNSGELSASDVLEAWDSMSPVAVKGLASPHLDQDIEFYSLLFKVIKLLYCQGKLQVAEVLITTIKATVACNEELQSTKIKNGFNYFQYIMKILPLKKNFNELSGDALYIVGDSHCLSPAWGPVTLNGINYQTKPLLVTGCKIWHLRDGSFFHAKTNFNRAIEQIPEESVAMFLFGEIDCREGILPSVIKGVYSSPVKAIEKLIDIYFKRILEVIRARKLSRLYIHQIPPVLIATREIVNEFNLLLEQKIRKLNNDKISWLGFKGSLLAENGDFNSEFGLDETHLHPSYIHTSVS